MEPERARTIGRIQATKAASIGLGLAYLIMAGVDGNLGWLGRLPRWWPNLLAAIVLMYLCAYVYGGWAGSAILERKQDAGWIGTIYAVWTLLTVAFLASWVGFFQEGLAKVGTNENPFAAYIAAPLFWVSVVGFLPAALVGLWFGNSVKRAGKHA
jgi:hypothetical protein